MVDLRQSLFEFRRRVIIHPRPENLQNFTPMITSDGQYKGKAEFFLIAVIKDLEIGKFFRRTIVEIGAGLFRGGLFRKFPPHGQLTGKDGMSPEKCQLRFTTGLINRICHQGMKGIGIVPGFH